MQYNGNTLTGDEVFEVGDIIDFDYSGSMKHIKLPACRAKIECWGAQSAGDANINLGSSKALGAYTSGNLITTEARDFYIYVGGQGNYGNAVAGGFNGGGRAGASTALSGSGGGSTDIRLVGREWNDMISLRSRIMVAAGAGGSDDATKEAKGAANDGSGGYAGDLVGGEPRINGALTVPGPYGATQTTGYAFGVGEPGGATDTGGGGGGYYGGKASQHSNGGAGGGSSFISGFYGCNAINEHGLHTGQPIHYSGLIFVESSMSNGVQNMLDPRTGNEIIGNAAHGFCRIQIINFFEGEIYFVYFEDNTYYHNGVQWVSLDKNVDDITIQDIVEHGMGNDSPYLKTEYLHTLETFGVSGPIRYIVGTQTIEELRIKEIFDWNRSIGLNMSHKFKIKIQ